MAVEMSTSRVGWVDRWSDRKRSARRAKVASYLVLSIGAVVMLVPFIWMISTSLKPAGEVFEFPPRLFGSSMVWSNYLEVFKNTNFLMQLWNSIFISVITLVGTLVTSSMAGFAFSWFFRFRLKNSIFVILLVSIMIPYHVLLVPQFSLLRQAGLLDTPWSIILPTIVSPFGIFLMRQFYQGVPHELAEAARIDGCSPWTIYWRIFLPLSKPALATLSIFTFVNSWNDFLRPLIFLNDNSRQTLTLGIYTAQGLFATDWPILMTTVTLSLLPVVVLFLFMQDLFVEGVALTGMK